MVLVVVVVVVVAAREFALGGCARVMRVVARRDRGETSARSASARSIVAATFVDCGCVPGFGAEDTAETVKICSFG